MKIAVINDKHWGARNDSDYFHDYFMEFYENIFFKTLEEQDIKVVILAGDITDRRKSISFKTLNRLRTLFIERLETMGIKIISLIGNHDCYYKNTNDVNSVNELFSRYQHVKNYSEPVTVHIGGVDIDLIPWINEENYTSVMEFVENSCSKLAFAHLELQDFQMHLGSVVSKGMSPDIFEKYYAVYTGHYHHKSSRKNINYLGAPYEMTWADEGDDRGFHLVDLDTCTLEYVKNPYKMFNKVFYDDTVGDYDEFDVDQYQGKIVKLIVSNKTKPEMYEKFIRRLEMVNTCDLQLIDEVAVSYDTDISVDLNKDTLNLLLECVDGNADMPDEYDNAVKNVLTSVYMETSDNG